MNVYNHPNMANYYTVCGQIASLDFESMDSAVYKDCEATLVRFGKRAKRVHAGRNRLVFEFKNYVVKIPRNDAGLRDNAAEYRRYTTAKAQGEASTRARARIYNGDGGVVGIPVLFMERVNYAAREEIIERLGQVPAWVDAVDCGQVGFNKYGALLAFDYGCS